MRDEVRQGEDVSVHQAGSRLLEMGHLGQTVVLVSLEVTEEMGELSPGWLLA